MNKDEGKTSVYTSMRTYRFANGGVAHGSPPSFNLRDMTGKEWYMEWHHYSGPTVLNRRNDDVLDKQPGQRSAFWFIAQLWFDQGAKVVDGFGVYELPATRVTKWERLDRKNLVRATDDATGPDIIERIEFVDAKYNDKDWLRFAPAAPKTEKQK